MQRKFRRLALIGCGLMGGSFALAAREAGRVEAVTGYSLPHASAEQFHEKGIIDDVAASIRAAVADADLVMVAVPVASMGSVLAELADALTDNALLMDVSSTKRSVVADAQRLLGRHLPNFVPAHPIAGKERAGAGDPHALLYQQRKVILTPLDCTRPQQLQRARELWAAIGSEVSILSPAAHDRGLAAVSHLPHLLAFAYMTGLLEQADSAELLALGGPGFRDFSRIAGCDPTVWRDILRDNRDKTLEQLASFRHALAKFESLMQADDPEQLAVLLQQASNARVAWQAVPVRS
jgi:prephenate dehydrogenase